MRAINALLLVAALILHSNAHGDARGFGIPLQRVQRVRPLAPSANILSTDVSMINRHEL